MRIRAAPIVWLVVAGSLAGCAQDVVARFPSAPDAATGTVILLLSQPADDVAVAVNGTLVVHDEHTRRIVLERVPIGSNDLVLASSVGEKTMHVWVDGDRPTTIPIGIPDAGGSFLKSLLGTIMTVVVYSVIHP